MFSIWKTNRLDRRTPPRKCRPAAAAAPLLSSRLSSSTGSTTPYTSEPIASTSNAEDVSVSAESVLLRMFERKLGPLKCNEDDAKMADAPTEESLDGHRLINVSTVQGLIDALLCSTRRGEMLSLQERGTGSDLLFVVRCASCGDIVTAPHLPPIGKSQQNELGMRLGVGKDCGISFSKLSNIFWELDAPPPMHVKPYQCMMPRCWWQPK